MKKNKYIATLMTIIISLVFGSPAFAVASLSASQSNVYVGDTFAVSLSIDAVAAWNVHISSVGPVENCTLVDADVTEDALNTEKHFVAECQTTGVGEITVSLSGDYTTADGVTTELSDNLTVTVEEKPEEEPEPKEEPIDEVPGSSTTGNTPDTGGNYGKSEVDTSESNYFAVIVTALILLLLGLVIRRRYTAHKLTFEKKG